VREIGIQMQHTVPYTPQQNGVAERKNRTLKEMANCMLQSKGLSLSFWAEAINCANYIINRTPTKVLKNITPEEAWSSIKPDVSHFRVFGSEAWAHIPDEKHKALEPKSEKCTFVGYSEDVKGYRLIPCRNLQGKFLRKNTKRTPLTTRSQINTPVFLTWLKPSKREIVHGLCQRGHYRQFINQRMKIYISFSHTQITLTMTLHAL